MSRIAKAAVVALGTGAVVLSGAGLALADAEAEGQAVGSPGILSGDVIEVPVSVPINLCGDTIDVIGLLNPAAGDTCINGDIERDHYEDSHYNRQELHHHGHHGHHGSREHYDHGGFGHGGFGHGGYDNGGYDNGGFGHGGYGHGR